MNINQNNDFYLANPPSCEHCLAYLKAFMVWLGSEGVIDADFCEVRKSVIINSR